MENLEIEYKALINKEDYNTLLNYIMQFNYFVDDQTNYYYDDEKGSLKKLDLNLRIRSFKDKNECLLTLKETKGEGRLETEFPINKNDLSLANDIIKNKLANKGVDINSLKVIASLRTIRYELKENGYNFCIDHSFYNGLEDYEIECESDSLEHAKAIIDTFLKPFNIEYKKSPLSKQARAKLLRK